MQKIIILKGLPASGKSSWAKQFILDNPKEKWKRVNKDDLRGMIDVGKWSGMNEKFVLMVRDNIVQSALGMGYNVIIDDTNFNPEHERRVRLVAEGKADVEVKFFDVPVEECIKRDAGRPNSVGADVIYKMYNQYLFKPENYLPELSLPLAVICDIDGTLAKNTSRGFFDWHKVGSDKVHQETAFIIASLKSQGVKIIIVSGRDGCCEKETLKWLADNDIQYDEFYMRDEGNSERDEIIKERIYRNKIDGRFVVMGVFDDRPQVVRMWKRLGLFVFDCNQDYYKIEF